MSISIKEAKQKISDILDDVCCSKSEYDNVVQPIENALKIDESDNEFIKNHPVGFCKIPTDIDSLPKLTLPTDSLGATKFTAPKYVNNMGSASKTEDQGQKPWCAAYSCANWCEFIKWKLDGYITQVDPAVIYKYAKSIDGDPNGDGTTLVAVLQALLDKGYFDKKVCKIKNIWKCTNARELVKYAIFKFGAILLAFNISEEWYSVNKNKTSVTGSGSTRKCGGHAVIGIGYNEDGVFIQNSWNSSYGKDGFLLLTWDQFDEQFLYASVLSNCLDGLTLNT